ncbi:hypothetical protein AGABI1DRAFT_85119 [Agaricus bisporus var. burnettii JB137-S8]|uniref:Uncharacterized protein n=1 Tax=Agaricus bisporus var. burnettii (strain JB137-S8 / ATCC MYA-4627 / FGSC 10392) TaxID=597362 RepID=K5X7S6_AGABU|nr:uncharacterized protein AGABI1DRAFT_85119 [Agaricus bisporus var. burnettii JB137-S8]EKM79253.1 hypothetical protein AGABI1DRAFT_85119 [Agaricus bisporus var. burnettii JB137-S8]
MTVRLARSAFASLRASARPRANFALAAARRNMSAQSHAGDSKKSDMPWIVGSAVVFGPLFLYLLSPSARKSKDAHGAHHSHQETPSSTEENHEPEAQKPEIMTDDEGTPADVTSTIALAEASDVPKDSQAPDVVDNLTAAAQQAPAGEATTEEATTTTGDAANETASAPKATEQAPETTEHASETTPAEPAAETSSADTTTSAKSEPSSST